MVSFKIDGKDAIIDANPFAPITVTCASAVPTRQFARRSRMLQPAPAQSRHGNPVSFSRKHLSEGLDLGGDRGARSLLQVFPVFDVAVDDLGIANDIDMSSNLLSLR